MSDLQQSGPSAPVLELMQQGLTIVRAENENMQAMAIQRPRNVGQLTKSAIEELHQFPKYAAKMYYSIPYKDRSKGEEREVLVEGPSIKAANALARAWGNNSSGFRIIGGDDERVNIQGVFVDHETGMRRTAEISVSRIARKKDGTYYPLAADRLNMAIQAGGSKAVRNAILNALPIGLVELYFAAAQSIAARGGKLQDEPKTDEANIIAEMENSCNRFEALGVERVEVMMYLERRKDLKDMEAKSAHLVGLLSALDDGQTTIDDIFTVPQAAATIPEPQQKQQPPKQDPPRTSIPSGSAPMRDGDTMIAKFTSGTCFICKKPKMKGEKLRKNQENGLWLHAAC